MTQDRYMARGRLHTEVEALLDRTISDAATPFCRPSARRARQAWATFQADLDTLLVSPGDKRRVGAELKPNKVDEDDAAAEAAIADVLQLVPGAGTG